MTIILPVFEELHWLPVKLRVTFKLYTMVFNIKQRSQLSYLCELLCDYDPTRCLRSSTQESDILRKERRQAGLLAGSRVFSMSPPTQGTVCQSSIRCFNSFQSFQS